MTQNYPKDAFGEWLIKLDIGGLINDINQEQKRRKSNPDWERPVVMYGIRKMTHKCIKKTEIAIIIDRSPWQNRARMAETHWYNIVYKRPATDTEIQESSGSNRRYWVFSYYVDKRWGADKIVSQITQDDKLIYGISEEETNNIIKAFERKLGRKLRIYPINKQKQLNLFEV